VGPTSKGRGGKVTGRERRGEEKGEGREIVLCRIGRKKELSAPMLAGVVY